MILLRTTKSPNYVPSIVAPVELFYVMNDINLNSKRLHKMFPTRTQVGGYGVCPEKIFKYVEKHKKELIEIIEKTLRITFLLHPNIHSR